MARARSVLVAARRPLHKTPMAVANACFVGTLLTDAAYWQSAEMMWADFSAWLLLAGLLVGVLAVLAALVDLFTDRLSGEAGRVWPYLLGSLIVLVMSLFNALVHSRDAWTSVVPTGLILSAAAVIVILLVGLLGWSSGRTQVEVVE
ncbi:DUF2231 domain-containing protein [Mesorhizobium sp. M7A.F.Ca.CA.001.07.2.1]|uniref:DUF2231 domain-containing protein n=2 Tax=Phyllobacteriaceae TaxID=69277 RepID=UPI000FCC74FB|nr:MULTISPECIES: DUF2231 domain-containing protein [Mesorhizobium]RVB36218.1 DUF2231 domain-containing protein [Mesorhizobium sp. M7A.F.Ca.CA.004.05.1.1]MCF6126977.1 DUF2231 domain-containing protein [Mesorhizobium ciceri]MCQ8816586.1 DUF2231 domain-containing protein [Mesorhizobium sp. SEMIA396]RUX79666.1 DUF2231 domain-containing protein [Mesorhizobium sp. M7A.F.Ca.CA.004.08.2.1]RUX84891.1 DUF2231 domain-containing protein [Mesorhizobium sp. M7A.F.Ca.CA.004.08.1.1]